MKKTRQIVNIVINISPFFCLLLSACDTKNNTNDSKTPQNTPSALAPTQAPTSTPASAPPPEPELNTTTPSRETAKLYLTNKLSTAEQQRLFTSISDQPNPWLHEIYSALNESAPNETQSFQACEYITPLKISQERLEIHQKDPFIAAAFPLLHHQKMKQICENIIALTGEISEAERHNQALENERSEREDEAQKAIMALLAASLNRDEVAKSYWLLKGFLINPGDR